MSVPPAERPAEGMFQFCFHASLLNHAAHTPQTVVKSGSAPGYCPRRRQTLSTAYRTASMWWLSTSG